MSKFAYINSKYKIFKDAKIHVEDRGLQFSDSIYEVIPFFKEKLIDYSYHIKRLKFSLKQINLKFKFDKTNFKKIINKLIILNNIKNGIIYIQITRGLQKRDHAYKKNIKPNLIIYPMKKNFNLPNKNFKGKKAITAEDLRWKRRDIKSVSLLANVLAKKIAESKGAYEAILIDKNIVTEGCSSNVWIIKKKILITHPTNTDILKGITRQAIKKLLIKEKITFKEKKFTKNYMLNADEVFVTSSGSFVTPIIKIDGVKINEGKIGKITKKLADLYYQEIKNA